MVVLLSPFTPHVCEELWAELGGAPGMTNLSWPVYDASILAQDEVVIVVQVNGKKRGEVHVPSDASEEFVKTAAFEEPNVKKFIEGKTVKKTVLVPGRLLNVVVV
jgi:leucyl-tRNA synthetase